MKIIRYDNSYLNDVKQLLSVEEVDPRTGESYNLELFRNKYFTSFLRVESGEVVATISVSVRLYVLEINHLFVCEKHRGKGVATKLVRKAIRYAEDEGCESVVVNTAENNVVAQKLYEKLGFEQAGKVFDYFNNGLYQLFFIRKF